VDIHSVTSKQKVSVGMRTNFIEKCEIFDKKAQTHQSPQDASNSGVGICVCLLSSLSKLKRDTMTERNKTFDYYTDKRQIKYKKSICMVNCLTETKATSVTTMLYFIFYTDTAIMICSIISTYSIFSFTWLQRTQKNILIIF
jgi:hypothetical protein